MNTAIRCRLYPTIEQEELFQKTFGCCRKVWNLMLSDKKDYYQKEHKTLKTTPAMYKEKYPYLKEVDSLALANVQLDLEGAYERFFNKISKFPKFKSKHKSRKSFTTNNQEYITANKQSKQTIWLNANNTGLHLPKMKRKEVVKITVHRKFPNGAKLKSVTVSQDSDGKYYASLLFEIPDENINPVSDVKNAKVIGLDYKSDGL